ncbi:actinia tenebrosa protease inhibitors-like [Amblyomma americanum]
MRSSPRERTEPNCFVPPNAGSCNGRLFRYYFHWGVGRCIRYVYTGCEGTGNNFRSRQMCMRTCWFQNYNIYCKLPMDRGQCGSWVVRYHYDKEKNHCFPFWFSGCGGNLNRFRSAQECRAVCIPD